MRVVRVTLRIRSGAQLQLERSRHLPVALPGQLGSEATRVDLERAGYPNPQRISHDRLLFEW